MKNEDWQWYFAHDFHPRNFSIDPQKSANIISTEEMIQQIEQEVLPNLRGVTLQNKRHTIQQRNFRPNIWLRCGIGVSPTLCRSAEIIQVRDSGK